MEHGTITREATGNFPFHFWIEKAVASEVGGKMVVEGVASTGNVDHDKERMSPEALNAMAQVVNEVGVPLRIEHSQKDNAIVGTVNKGWIDDRGQFWIRAELDPSHVAAPLLYNALKTGGRYGLSVGGFVKRAAEELVEGVGHAVKTFYDIVLDEVSVTQHPSNYDAIGLKAVKSRIKETDYLQAFAKSIPANEWQRVDKNYKLEDKSMKKEKTEEMDTDEKATKAEDSAEDTKETKSVSRKEFGELTKMVSEGFNAITMAISKVAKAGISVDAHDKNQPDENKETPEGQDRNVTKGDGNEANDQANPNKKKEDPQDTQEAAVTKDREGQEDADGNGDDEKGEREKSAKKRTAKDDKEPKADESETYDMATVQRAIKRIEAVAKGIDDMEEDKTTKAEEDEKTTKAEDDEEKTTKGEDTERTTKSKLSPIDVFALTVANSIERMEKSMKDNGFQTNHIAKAVVENIRSNPEYQADIKSMLREPGAKKSVIMGTPFVKTRDGRMFKLTVENHPQNKVEKSADGKKLSFKEMWGSGFSSTQEEK